MVLAACGTESQEPRTGIYPIFVAKAGNLQYAHIPHLDWNAVLIVPCAPAYKDLRSVW
jgi:hypothetical protein